VVLNDGGVKAPGMSVKTSLECSVINKTGSLKSGKKCKINSQNLIRASRGFQVENVRKMPSEKKKGPRTATTGVGGPRKIMSKLTPRNHERIKAPLSNNRPFF